MKKLMCILLLVSSGLMLAQTSKTLVTINGEKLKYDQKMTTAQRDAIVNPAEGLLIYNTTTKSHEYYDGTGWYNYATGIKGNPSSGGTAEVSAFTCDGSSTGTMTAGTAVSGVTKTITATVTRAGTYTITANANGVTFIKTGTFGATGTLTVTLQATGTPTVGGVFSYALSTTPSCSFTFSVVSPPPTGSGGNSGLPIVSASGRVWLDRPLGATTPASLGALTSYGSLYQWGRGNDGHQLMNWVAYNNGVPVNTNTGTLSTVDTPAHNQFISVGTAPNDWRSVHNDNLWQGVNGTNNPCPSGYRIPTIHEIRHEFISNGLTGWRNGIGPFVLGSQTGYRQPTGQWVYGKGAIWSSTVSGTGAYVMTSDQGSQPYHSILDYGTLVWGRAHAAQVRCIKD